MTKLKLASSNHIQIEKGVPMPGGGAPASGGTAWPLNIMEVGDSFSLVLDRVTALRSAIAYERSKCPGKKFTVRSLPTEIRCWRTA